MSSPRLLSGNHTRCLWPTKKQETITGGVAHSLFSSTVNVGERNKSLQRGYRHSVGRGDNVTPNYCCLLHIPEAPDDRLLGVWMNEHPLNLS